MERIGYYFVFCLYLERVWCVADQCMNYKTLPRDNERSKDYATPGGLTNIPCDNNDDGWYRFGSGDIATSCVPTNHCGTSSTVWMKDPVPQVGETRVNTFCVNHKTGSSSNPCCLFPLSINVTNCNGFMVYYLKKDDLLCPSGYCKGDLKPCPNGQTSTTGFQPCTVTYPAMLGPPTLGPPHITTDGHDFTQTCTINYNASEPDATFDLTWYFDGTIYRMTTLSGGTLSDTITSTDWKGHIGKGLTCSVVPYFKSKTERGKEFRSSSYLGAITMSPSPITMTEGDEADITLTSTLPTVCSKASRAACKMDLLLAVKSGNPNNIFSKGSCNIEIKSDDWDPVTNKAVAKTTLSTIIDTVVKPTSIYNVAFRALPDILGHTIWDTYDMEGVNITLNDVRHGVCMLTGDPEITGLNKKEIFIAYTPGDYVMYKSTNSQNRKLEVAVRLWAPLTNAASVCAVGIAYDDTLVKVDMCTNHIGESAPILTRAGSHPDDIDVYSCGSQYEVLTGDGVRVTIIAHDLNLDIKLHLPPTFGAKAEGLCTYSGAQDSLDVTTINHYRANAVSNILTAGSQAFIAKQQSAKDPSSWFCHCGVVNGGCQPFERVKYPRSAIDVDAKGKLAIKSDCHQSFPKPLVYLPFRQYGDYTPKRIHINLPNPPVGYWATQIETKCHEYISNFSSSFCLRENSENYDTFVKSCQNDHRGSGTFTYINSAIQGFQWSCEENILHNASYYHADAHGNLVPPSEVTTEVCPNFCSRAGSCVNGSCTCNPGSFGKDCSITKSNPPQILSIMGGATCQMSHQTCQTPTLVVKNIVDSHYLRAKLTLLEVDGQKEDVPPPLFLDRAIRQSTYQYIAKRVDVDTFLGVHYGRAVPTNKTFEIPAVFENRYSVSVPLSAFIGTLKDQTAFRIDIQLTDNGQNYTSPLQYFVFDDKCHYCNMILGGCFERENACRIDGKCYASAEKNPSSSDEVCDPTNAIMSWTKVAAANPLIIGR